MHWIMPIIGTGIFGFGAMMTLYVLVQRNPIPRPLYLYLCFFQPPNYPLPRGYFYLCSFRTVRGIGASSEPRSFV